MSFRRSFGRLGIILDRRHSAKQCVMTALIIVLSPRLDHGASVGQPQEPADVQALIAQAIVERLHEGIVGRLARPANVERHAVLVRPAVQCLRSAFKMNSGP